MDYIVDARTQDGQAVQIRFVVDAVSGALYYVQEVSKDETEDKGE